MPVPQGIPTGLGQVVKADPYIAAGGAGEVFPPYTPVFLREVGVVAVGVDCIRIGPLNLGGRWVDLEPTALRKASRYSTVTSTVGTSLAVSGTSFLFVIVVIPSVAKVSAPEGVLHIPARRRHAAFALAAHE